jgi:predicted RNA-binding Zn-ribbon protein involved in translation (DUF1610 family)
MRKKRDNYQCPRCGYDVNNKYCMRRHLYLSKNTCPALNNNIELTEDIKEYILANRIYKPLPPLESKQNFINATINNYNNINNFIANMDVFEKLTKYTEHKNIEIIDFEDKVDMYYSRQVKRLENGNTKANVQLKLHDMYDIIDVMSDICQGDIKNFNIIYDEKINKLKCFRCGEWKTYLLESGIKELIETIQRYYLDSYECYLIRKTRSQDSSVFSKTAMKELLSNYYQFLACFDITPFVYNKNDYQVLYNSDDEKHHTCVESSDISKFAVADEFNKLYNDAKSKTPASEVNKQRKAVKDIIKRNTKSNIVELNKKMLSLFQMDEEFKTSIINNIICDAKDFQGTVKDSI